MMEIFFFFFSAVKLEFSMEKKNDVFLIFAQNIDCGYTFEPSRRGGYNEYPQCMFLIKTLGIPLQTPVFLYASEV